MPLTPTSSYPHEAEPMGPRHSGGNGAHRGPHLITAEAYVEAQKCLRRGRAVAVGEIDTSAHRVLPRQYRLFQYREIVALAARRFDVPLDLGYSAELPEQPEQAYERTIQVLRTGRAAAGCWFVAEDCAGFVPLMLPADADRESTHRTSSGSLDGQARDREISWDLVFIHAAARSKRKHIQEAEFAFACVTACGVLVNRVLFVSVNKRYVRREQVNPAELFVIDDVSALVTGNADKIAARIRELKGALDLLPERIPACDRPHACPVCRKGLPELPHHSIFTLFRAGELSQELFNAGVRHLEEIPDGVSLSNRQRIQVSAVRQEAPHIDRVRLTEFLSSIRYPRAFLDFETYSAAVPPFSGIRPWQHVPFQFSLHCKESVGAPVTHTGFIEEFGRDQREELLRRLMGSLPPSGSIVVFGSNFERTILRSLAEQFPVYATAVQDAAARIVDLSLPFQNFWYYHPQQRGRLSLKAILPALTDTSYSNLRFADGLDASTAYYLAAHSTALTCTERAQVRADLDEYCAMDTRALVEVLSVLEDGGAG